MLDQILVQRDIRLRPREPRQFGHQGRVLDIQAEGRQPDLGRLEVHRRLAEQRIGIVDDAHDLERCADGVQPVADAEAPHEPQRAVEQRDGAAGA